MASGETRAARAIVAATVVAAPAALALETLLRWLLFGPEMEELRGLLAPNLTPAAWLLAGLAAIAAAAGLGGQRFLARRRLAELPEDPTESQRMRALLGVFLLTTTVPQVPAILATLAAMFGAALLPVLVGIAVSTLGVLGQAWQLARQTRGT